MTPSAVPRKVRNVWPSRAAASTQTNRAVRFVPEPLLVRAARARCWLRHPRCAPPRAVRYSADHGQRSGRSGRRALRRARRSPSRSRRPGPVRPEQPDCRTQLSCARSPRRWSPSSITSGREEKFGMFATVMPKGAAAPAKSRSLPAFEVASRIYVASRVPSMFLCGPLCSLWLSAVF